MKQARFSLALASSLAFALAACGDDDVETEPLESETALAVAEFDPMTRDYVLSDEAQARRGEFDEAAFQMEYASYRDEIAASGETPTGTSTDTSADATATATDAAGSTGTDMPERSAMSWTYLDRNGDGQLSVAEYAIWAIPLDPTKPKPNDQAPYVTAEQANKAADSFFYYDTDGDSYLSQREFTTARRGDTIG